MYVCVNAAFLAKVLLNKVTCIPAPWHAKNKVGYLGTTHTHSNATCKHWWSELNGCYHYIRSIIHTDINMMYRANAATANPQSIFTDRNIQNIWKKNGEKIFIFQNKKLQYSIVNIQPCLNPVYSELIHGCGLAGREGWPFPSLHSFSLLLFLLLVSAPPPASCRLPPHTPQPITAEPCSPSANRSSESGKSMARREGGDSGGGGCYTWEEMRCGQKRDADSI